MTYSLMMKSLLPPTIALALLLGGCAVTPSYGPAMDANDFGYRDRAIEDDRYRVAYRGKDSGSATDGALRRAAELTVQSGYDFFTVVSRDLESERRRRGRGPSVGVGGSTGGWGGSRVGIGVNLPLGDSGGADVARVEFVMGRGVKPASNDSYNARAVLERLVP